MFNHVVEEFQVDELQLPTDGPSYLPVLLFAPPSKIVPFPYVPLRAALQLLTLASGRPEGEGTDDASRLGDAAVGLLAVRRAYSKVYENICLILMDISIENGEAICNSR